MLAISARPLSEKYEKIILFVFIPHIVFYKTIPGVCFTKVFMT